MSPSTKASFTKTGSTKAGSIDNHGSGYLGMARHACV